MDNLKFLTNIYSEAANGVMTRTALLLILSLFLTAFLYLLYIWIRKYKLKYLFRISFLAFIFSLPALCISHLFSAYKEIILISPLFQTSFWSTASTVSGLTCFTMIIIRYFWVLPINIFIEESGSYSHLEEIAKSRHQTIQEVWSNMFRNLSRDSNQVKQPVYPNGWIPLIESTQVPPKKIVSVGAIGYRFCIFRGQEGKVFVTDAFCPHMGADISAGGRVIGNCIECPFHGWQFFGETGKCTRVPYSDKIPDTAQIKVWKTCEKNGYVFIWHHAENESPTWELPSVPEIENGEWVYKGRAEFRLHCHIQDVLENAADATHFSPVHSPIVLHWPQVENAGAGGPWIQQHFKTQWMVDEGNTHIANFKVSSKLSVCGFGIPYTEGRVEGQEIGPAIIHINMNYSFGRGVILQYITPEGPFLQRTVQLFFTEPTWKQSIANCFSWMESNMFQRDVMIWNNKIFVKNPLLVKEDHLISKFRRWYSQFYTEHSPSLHDLKERTLEW